MSNKQENRSMTVEKASSIIIKPYITEYKAPSLWGVWVNHLRIGCSRGWFRGGDSVCLWGWLLYRLTLVDYLLREGA
jgi:hypothetical protein